MLLLKSGEYHYTEESTLLKQPAALSDVSIPRKKKIPSGAAERDL